MIYSKRPKSGGSVSSVGTGYREKSPIPSALNPTPQILGASILEDTLEGPTRHRLSSTNDIDNPVFGEDNESPYNATMKSKPRFRFKFPFCKLSGYQVLVDS